jgi:hypothetical protein
MTPEALAALKGSIRHWHENVEAEDYFGTSTDVGACALCKAYWYANESISCEGCPVYARTGQKRCGGTPFFDAEEAQDAWSKAQTAIDNRSARIEWRKAAQAELNFLISLLPEGEMP